MKYFCVEGALHGISESGLHWFLTYYSYYKTQIGIELASGDMCFLYGCNAANLRGFKIFSVNASFRYHDDEFLELEQKNFIHFRSKSRKIFFAGETKNFNGLMSIWQLNKVRNVEEPKTSD